MRFIDTHSHLYDEAFHQEEDQAIERAVEAGVTKMILPDIDSQSRDAMFTLADRHPDTAFPCLGLHPTSIDASWEKELLRFPRLLSMGKKEFFCLIFLL